MKTILTSTIALFIYSFTIACTCVYEEDFFVNASDHSEYVMLVKFDSSSSNAFNFGNGHFTAIESFHNGPHSQGESFFINGGSGADCGQSFHTFVPGDTMVIAFSSGWDSGYHMAGTCGKFYLTVKNGKAEKMTIQEIKAKVNDVINGVSPPYQPDVFVYPNPTSDNTSLSSPAFYTLYDCLGSEITSGYGIEIKTNHLAAGNYVVVTTKHGRIERSLLMVK